MLFVIFKNTFTFGHWCHNTLTVTVSWCYVIIREWWFCMHFIHAEDFSHLTKSNLMHIAPWSEDNLRQLSNSRKLPQIVTHLFLCLFCGDEYISYTITLLFLCVFKPIEYMSYCNPWISVSFLWKWICVLSWDPSISVCHLYSDEYISYTVTCLFLCVLSMVRNMFLTTRSVYFDVLYMTMNMSYTETCLSLCFFVYMVKNKCLILEQVYFCGSVAIKYMVPNNLNFSEIYIIFKVKFLFCNS